MTTCPLCSAPVFIDGAAERLRVRCAVCGDYAITGDAARRVHGSLLWREILRAWLLAEDRQRRPGTVPTIVLDEGDPLGTYAPADPQPDRDAAA